MRIRFYFIGGIGIVVAALVGLISSLGIFRAIENLVTHEDTVVAVVGVLLASALAKTGGKIVYTFDDAYIHLALAENIARGHYGVN